TESITQYILNEAKVALVPFYAFGASTESTWYRLSVGTADVKSIPEVLEKLRSALQKLKA
ncbi:MAG TPA: pyridoxal phosphate-dependent aminotransferase, partial [Bacteroidia bacterium]|nr:pyridoxal phosphate-dependent aminotransferase [Bacteroidia bacterium]